MAAIKRLHAQETHRIQGETPVPAASAAVAPGSAGSSTLDELESMLSGESVTSTPSVADAPIEVSGQLAQAPAVAEAVSEPKQTIDTDPAPVGSGFLKRSREKAEKRQIDHRAALDYLNILKSLAPVFKAATIYPGHDAAPEVIGAAVRKMSQVSVGLADYIATHGDKLELDPAWSRKTLHDFTAELVASHWIATVIGKGGVVAGHSPDITVEFFIPAIRAVMELPAEVPHSPEMFDHSLAGAVHLSLLAAMAPISIEVEKFATIINARIPVVKVSADDLVMEISQFIMEQALLHHEKFIADNGDVTDDDRQCMLQALISHASGVILSAWEYCRGEVLGAIKDAVSVEQAAEIIAQSQFTHGFPLQAMKARAEDSLRRLTGTSQYALTMMRQSADRSNQQGAV